MLRGSHPWRAASSRSSDVSGRSLPCGGLPVGAGGSVCEVAAITMAALCTRHVGWREGRILNAPGSVEMSWRRADYLLDEKMSSKGVARNGIPPAR